MHINIGYFKFQKSQEWEMRFSNFFQFLQALDKRKNGIVFDFWKINLFSFVIFFLVKFGVFCTFFCVFWHLLITKAEIQKTKTIAVLKSHFSAGNQ